MYEGCGILVIFIGAIIYLATGSFGVVTVKDPYLIIFVLSSHWCRAKTSLLEHFDGANNAKLSTSFEDILKKDPTCSHSLAKLISMHQNGTNNFLELYVF